MMFFVNQVDRLRIFIIQIVLLLVFYFTFSPACDKPDTGKCKGAAANKFAGILGCRSLEISVENSTA